MLEKILFMDAAFKAEEAQYLSLLKSAARLCLERDLTQEEVNAIPGEMRERSISSALSVLDAYRERIYYYQMADYLKLTWRTI